MKRFRAAYWPNRKENVKDLQNRQCLWCGRSHGRHVRLEIDHIKKRENGGTDGLANIRALCRACHKLRHNAERHMPAVSRLIIGLQILTGASDSALVNGLCRILFKWFLLSPAGTTFHPAVLHLRNGECSAQPEQRALY